LAVGHYNRKLVAFNGIIIKNVGRPLVGLLFGNEDFYSCLPWRPTRGLPTFSSILLYGKKKNKYNSF